jgi:hypothetical protein
MAPTGSSERETTSQHAAREETATASDLHIEERTPPIEPRIVQRPLDKTAHAFASQPITLQAVIDHIFGDEGRPGDSREPQPMQPPSTSVEQLRDNLEETSAPPLVSIGRIDISVAPPLPGLSRETGPPRSQGFASYSRIRRGQER